MSAPRWVVRTGFFTRKMDLSRLELSLNEFQPLLLGSSISDDNAILTVDLTNPDLFFEKRLILAKDTVHILRTAFLWRGVAYQK